MVSQSVAQPDSPDLPPFAKGRRCETTNAYAYINRPYELPEQSVAQLDSQAFTPG